MLRVMQSQRNRDDRALDATPAFGVNLDNPSLAACIPRVRRKVGTPLGPVEKFVFERIDGSRSIGDLAALVGLTPRETFHVVSRLVDLRIVEIVFDIDDEDLS